MALSVTIIFSDRKKNNIRNSKTTVLKVKYLAFTEKMLILKIRKFYSMGLQLNPNGALTQEVLPVSEKYITQHTIET